MSGAPGWNVRLEAQKLKPIVQSMSEKIKAAEKAKFPPLGVVDLAISPGWCSSVKGTFPCKKVTVLAFLV
jgi:hypothetical protein